MIQAVIGFYYRTKTPEQVQELVSNCSMIAVSDYENNAWAQAVKALSPTKPILLYSDIRAINMQWWKFNEIETKLDAFVRNPRLGSYEQRLVRQGHPYVTLMNPYSLAWRSWASRYLERRLLDAQNLYSGVFLDEAHDFCSNEPFYYINTTTPATVPQETKDTWAYGTKLFLSLLKQRMPSGKILVTNSGYLNRYMEQCPYIDGSFSESDAIYRALRSEVDGNGRTVWYEDESAPSYHKWGELWIKRNPT